MAFSIYKPGQGYWTRMLSAVGAGMLVAAGAAWLWRELGTLETDNTLYVQGAAVAVMIFGIGLLLMWIMNKPNVVEFMIATEAEMKKVSWPSRRELISLTILVIGGTILVAALLFGIDIVFAFIFRQMGVLEGG